MFYNAHFRPPLLFATHTHTPHLHTLPPPSMNYHTTHTHTHTHTQPLVTNELILKLQSCSDLELIEVLQTTTVWRFGKVTCYGWALFGTNGATCIFTTKLIHIISLSSMWVCGICSYSYGFFLVV